MRGDASFVIVCSAQGYRFLCLLRDDMAFQNGFSSAASFNLYQLLLERYDIRNYGCTISPSSNGNLYRARLEMLFENRSTRLSPHLHATLEQMHPSPELASCCLSTHIKCLLLNDHRALPCRPSTSHHPAEINLNGELRNVWLFNPDSDCWRIEMPS